MLLTGATGYVGGRLLTALLAAGHRVRCLARRPEVLRARLGGAAEVVQGDLLDPGTLPAAMEGVPLAYYLVHSMMRGARFEAEDRIAAANFARAARQAGVRRIIYLGGLTSTEGGLSPHLRSRLEVGEELRSHGVPVLEYRASIIIGSGSLSFELIRALAERLPVMVTPRWVHTPAQPIAIEDVIQYLVLGLTAPNQNHAIYEIGGADVVSYGELILEYARQRGLRRMLLPVPFLTPRLSSLWLGLVTPLYARVGRQLIEGVRNPSMVRNPAALEAFPVRPMGVRQAIERALRNEDREFAETRWSDALAFAQAYPSRAGLRVGTRFVDSRTLEVPLPPYLAFAPIRRIGGRTGWYYANPLWRIRGWLDLLAGGAGLRRGRRDPEQLRPGDALDFWRVEAYEPDRRLRLAAEMKLPGRAWLEFEALPGLSGTTLRQTAVFDAVGLTGLAYWWLVYPLHALVFRGMLRRIAREAMKQGSPSGQ
ncbi:MAG: SDR family oxidoreductase [Bryobacteraceae bacterium]|nr:SDR family oxidoreductase [Bryobacteraceae bacterium]